MNELLIAVGLFTLIVFMLVSAIMFAKAKLLPSGDIKLVINKEKELVTQPGGKLLGSLAEQGEFDGRALRRAIVYGSVVASFCVEDFGPGRLREVSRDDIEKRFRQFMALTDFHS